MRVVFCFLLVTTILKARCLSLELRVFLIPEARTGESALESTQLAQQRGQKSVESDARRVGEMKVSFFLSFFFEEDVANFERHRRRRRSLFSLFL